MFQFGCVVAYQVFNDPNLSFDIPWYNPFSRKASKAAKEDKSFEREKYMPMNFFNLFWVFMVACVAGLFVETWFCWFERGVIEDRAGLLFGPFSPIYGFGAVLMTIALNRFWNKNPIIIFIVSGIIGAGFEFFTSWYMEVSFGIISWDYSDAFLNLDGRTDLAHAVAWGALGFIWIRFFASGDDTPGGCHQSQLACRFNRNCFFFDAGKRDDDHFGFGFMVDENGR